MQEMFITLIGEIAFLLTTIAIYFVIQLIRKKLRDEDLKIVRAIVEDGVLFVQQAYKHLKGEEKYKLAVASITAVLKERGVKISEDELKILIESTLKRLKAHWGDLWDKQGQSP